ncbi:MAG: 16S rRNA (guanine(527)-N(7))-methyltransferase RsmG [Selenomonadaceae bacterium]|nr:16S rRNA (guanine(527)-N(7))-methyltransferase RsmG [Selenomonadaceae bacterium]
MFEDKLKQAFKEYGLEVNLEREKKFGAFYRLIIEWNEKMNLTAITEEDEFVRKHILDSLSGLDYIGTGRILDLGSGAGFPGIPLKIYNEAYNITFLDALKKRLHFLDEVANNLSLQNVTTIHGRAEDLAKTDLRESFDTVVSRAVASLPVLSEYALPFLKVGGTFIAWKGSKAKDEAKESEKALKVLGGELEEIKEVAIPKLTEERALIIIRKSKTTPKEYPRKPGTPQKKPL